jgi:plasmid stability protein
MRRVPPRTTVAPFWRYNGSIALSLSVKDVPEDLAQALRERAARNHRSLQGELMHILESAVGPKPFRARALQQRLRQLGFTTPDESTAMIREDRDSR